MNKRFKLLLFCVAVPLAVGVLSALLSGSGMKAFADLNQPPLSPPGWVFPVAWTILYTLMGIASFYVLTAEKPQREIDGALRFYLMQLTVNFFWSILFFGFSLYLFSFLWLLLLWVLILITTIRFYRIKELSGYLMVPYLVWVTFAGYLNLGIYFLNR